MRNKIFIALLTFLLAAVCSTAAQNPADRILGVYSVVGETTNELSKVRIYKNGNHYDAQIIWLEKPVDAAGNRRLDVLNPETSLRNVPGDEVIIVRGLRYDSKKKQWSGGRIYNPVDGKTFDVLAEFESDKVLRVRGYMGRPMLGKNFFWDKLE